MTELLAPAGNMDALKAAVANGCDAVYLGMQKFGARAYSCNFDAETLKEVIDYAHLRGVKVYVTMNTIVFEDELDEAREQLRLINEAGADGVIIQDLAVFDYTVDNFVDMEAHCSTQMGLDDLEGALLMKELGAKRVVLARELDIDTIKDIKREAKIPIEIFVHGALCVSYSGNCLMSGMIGYRSGNRGRCVGSCRKPYELVNLTEGSSLGESYILSTKDLNTIDHIDDLREIDSLKIEGRMKEPVYVANVVSQYRKALDGKLSLGEAENLSRTFNRTFTKGYIFGEDRRDITNIQKPNNFGYEIGRISGRYKGMYEIALGKVLNQKDIIRIDHDGEDVNLSVEKLYDRDGRLINSADDRAYIRIQERLSVGDIVYKTRDTQFNKALEASLDEEFRRYPLDIHVYAYADAPLVIEAEGLGMHYVYESEDVLAEAQNKPTDRASVVKQFSKLKDTVFELGSVEFDSYNAFVPVGMLNNARREIVQGLCDAKLASQNRRTREPEAKEQIAFEPKTPYLTAQVQTQEQYDTCVRLGIEEIYFENVIRRNKNNYSDREGELLVGGYGGLYRYGRTNPVVTDYSLNVVNSVSVHKLHSLGAKRVTLSYELNKKQLRDLVDAYCRDNGGYPSLEMIVYGHTPLMFTNYCPLKAMGQCGKCKENCYELRDEYGRFPILSHEDCTTTILNGKILNLLDEMPSIEGVEAFRLNFTIESASEVEAVIRMAQAKLAGSEDQLFEQSTDTRGQFNKEII